MEFIYNIVDWFKATRIPQQIADVDYIGLFTNQWFIVPFAALLIYMIYKQQWRDLIIIGVCLGGWWVSGTAYMSSLIVNGEIVIDKILPLVFGGAIAIGFVIYLLFGRSD
jgi:hypothetical protein